MAEKMEADNEAMVALHQRVEDTHGCTLAETLKTYQSIHFEKAFKKWNLQIKSTHDPDQQPHFACTARRIFYRFELLSRLAFGHLFLSFYIYDSVHI